MSKITAIVNHKVSDFATWKKGFDAHEEGRKAFGITALGVYASAEDPNDVTLIAEGEAEAFDKMFSNPDLQEAMKASGVVSAPVITKLISQN